MYARIGGSIGRQCIAIAADIDGWDSLTNIRLLVQIEQELGVSFHSTEIADIPNVGELVDIIISKKF